MLRLTVKIEGRTLSDLDDALAEVRRSVVADGNTSGFDRNEDGRYSFDLDGEEEDARTR